VTWDLLPKIILGLRDVIGTVVIAVGVGFACYIGALICVKIAKEIGAKARDEWAALQGAKPVPPPEEPLPEPPPLPRRATTERVNGQDVPDDKPKPEEPTEEPKPPTRRRPPKDDGRGLYG
jgi:hypothetical protein